MAQVQNHAFATMFKLGKWPVKIAGEVPTERHFNEAFALLGSTRVTAETLAVAAYLRPPGPTSDPARVAKALAACLDVSPHNERRNVVQIKLGASKKARDKGALHLADVTMIDGGWHVVPTKRGQALIDKALGAAAKAAPTPTVEPPKVEAKPKAPRKPKAPKAPAVTADTPKVDTDLRYTDPFEADRQAA